MASTQNTEPTYYNSRFRHGVDEKRRVQIPAKWRPRKGVGELTLILWPREGVGSCVRVLAPAQMAKLMAEINAMSTGDRGKAKRFIGGNSAQVSMDKAGRICLPDEMARAADIKNEAVFVGCLDLYEIWSPEGCKKVQVADAVVAPDVLKMIE